VPDQEPARTVAAIEIPLKADTDRRDLVTILRRHAAADGTIHVDDVTSRWREFEAQNGPTLPGGKGTIFVGVWRGANDDELIADVDDMGHPGRAWVTFVKGKDIARAARFRQAVLADIIRRWSDAKSIPVLPSGGVPLPQDLTLTPSGYKITPGASATYELPKSSPLVAQS
jgi:hypothetical protein